MIKNLLTTAFVILLATEVQANCFKPEDVERVAKGQYNENVTHVGPTSSGELVRLYQNQETGTWTITVIIPQTGMECTLTHGEGWRSIKTLTGDPA